MAPQAEGGFGPEGTAAQSEAVCIAAAAYRVLESVDNEAPAPAEAGNFIATRDALELDDPDALTLHGAIQGQETADTLALASTFLALCRMILSDV